MQCGRFAQLRTLLINECSIDPQKLVSVLHYDGNPLTARFVEREIAEKAALFNLVPPPREPTLPPGPSPAVAGEGSKQQRIK